MKINPLTLFYLIMSPVCMTGMSILIHKTSKSLAVEQVFFIRSLLASLILMIPFIRKRKMPKLQKSKLLFSRSFVAFLTSVAFYFGLALIPVADNMALNFTMPIFVTLGAMFFFREKVGTYRWAAILAGFLGIIIILLPEFSGAQINWLYLLPLLAAILMSADQLIVKVCAKYNSPNVIALYTVVAMVFFSLPFALMKWQPVTMRLFMECFLIAVCSVGWQIFMIYSYKRTDASIVVSFDFIRLPLSTFLAFLIFDQLPFLNFYTGSVIIFVSVLFIAVRETRKRNAGKMPV